MVATSLSGLLRERQGRGQGKEVEKSSVHIIPSFSGIKPLQISQFTSRPQKFVGSNVCSAGTPISQQNSNFY